MTGDIHPLPESHLLDANNSSFTTTNGDDNNSNNSNVEEQKLEQQQEQQQKQPPPRLTHVPTDVTSWSALTTLFRTALNLHGHIDHVFAGAGVLVNGFDYLGDGNGEHASASSESTDESAEPTEPPEPSEPPNAREWAINFKAVVNTAYLGMYHMRRQRRQQQQQQNGTSNGHGSAAGGGGGKGGSIVLAASITSYILFRAADYCMSKHAVLGFMRGVLPRLIEQNASFAAAAAASGDADDASNGGTSNSAASAIRLNCISPSWTASGMVNKERFEAIGRADELQPPEAVAQTVALLMADEARQGQVVYSRQGKFWEIEERVQRVLEDEFLGGGHPDLVSRVRKTSIYFSSFSLLLLLPLSG